MSDYRITSIIRHLWKISKMSDYRGKITSRIRHYLIDEKIVGLYRSNLHYWKIIKLSDSGIARCRIIVVVFYRKTIHEQK